MSRTLYNPELPSWELDPAAYFSETSAEVSAVVWILETSTDPMVVTAAAELAVDLQWPLDRDLTSAGMCLREIFCSCFDSKFTGTHYVAKLRGNMAHCAITSGRAFCSLSNIAGASGQSLSPPWMNDLIEQDEDLDPQHWTQLSTVIQIINGSIDDPGDAISSDKWAFHAFASLDPDRHITSGQKGLEHFLDQLHVDKITSLEESTFTDYLCCINSFLAPVNPRMLVEVDKKSVVWFKQWFAN
jgi:hypothetical protein